MTVPQPWPGAAYPLGATYDGAGTNFALLGGLELAGGSGAHGVTADVSGPAEAAL